MRGPIAAEAEKAVLPQPSRKQSVVGGAVIAIHRPMRPGLPCTIGSAGWSSASHCSRAFTCFARAWTCALYRPNDPPGARSVMGTRMSGTPTTRAAWTSTTSPARRYPPTRQADRPAMADNPRMRRFRPRWLAALLGGIVLPFDPVLGMVMLMVGLWRPKRNPPPKVLP